MMQPARDFPAFGEADVVGGGFRVSSFPSNAGYNRHIANQPPQQRSHDRLDPRQLTRLAKQRFINRSNSYAQYGPYVYHEVLPSGGAQAEPAAAQGVHASMSSYGNRAAGRPSVPALQTAQAPSHVVTSVYPTSSPPSQPISSPPQPLTQEQQQPAEAAAATAEDSYLEAPDSPLKGVVIRSPVAPMPTATATAAAAASAAGTLAAAEAWLATVADQALPPEDPAAGRDTAAESFRNITLLPRRQLSAAEADAGGTPPMDAEAAQLPPTPTAVAGAAAPSFAGMAEAQFRGATRADSPPPMGLRVPSPQQQLGDSIQGPLPGGSSPKPRDGGSQLLVNIARGGHPSGVLSSSATGLLRAQSPAVYGSVVRRPATAAAAVPSASPVSAMNHPRLVRDAGMAPGQAYGYSAAAGSVITAAAAGEGQAEVLTIHPPQWESMSRLEADPSYVHYPTITAKGEFGGGVPHPHSAGGFFPPPPQAGPSWRSYLMRSRLSAPGSRSSANWSRSRGAVAAAARASAARASAASSPSPSDPVGLVNTRHPMDTIRAPTEAGYHETDQPVSKRGLWESRAALAGEARAMRAAARLLRAENRRLAGEAAALEDSVEGLAQGLLSPEFVRLHAESVERRLEFAEQYEPLVAARGSSRAPHTLYVGPYATEAEAVAAAAAEAAEAAATTAAEEARSRLSHPVQARPLSAPPATNSAAAAAQAALGRKGAGIYGDRAYGGGSPSRSQFRYIAPEELRLRRDLLGELQLRRRLSDALEDSRSAVLDLLVPVGADTDEMIQLVQTVRQQQQRNSAGQRTGASTQELTNNNNDSGTDPTPQPAAPAAAVPAAMAPAQRHVTFATDTRGGEDTVSSGGSNSDGGSFTAASHPPPSARSRPGSEAAAAAALAAAAAAAEAAAMAPSGSTYTVQMEQREGGEGTGGGGDDGSGAGEKTAATAEEEGFPQRSRRHLTDAMIRVLNARAAGELMYPRPPAPDPFGELDQGQGEGEAPPATPSAVRAFAILAAMGGAKMDIRRLRNDPRLSAMEQLLAPPASSLLALLYLSSRRPVPHPDDFVAGTDMEYVAVGGDMADGGGFVSPRPEPGASPLSGWPPAGDLFMDFNSPRRAPYGQTYRHVEAWSVRDAGLVLERQAREMELAGRYRMPRAYMEADKALKQRLNLDDPDLEDRADELRDQMQQQKYEARLQEAGEELRQAERERYGYVRSAPMAGAAATED